MEWKVALRGTNLGNGWKAFEVSLPDQGRRSFGKDGRLYRRLFRIRIRGSLAISPIKLYRALQNV
jgi:hypothetical protein